MIKLLALSGSIGCGKSTIAHHLVTRRGFTLIKFATPLKAMLRTLLDFGGMTSEEINEALEGKTKELPCDALSGATPRHAMQTLGTEWGRGCIDPNIWVHIATLRIIKLLANDQPVVVDDCRFENEAQAITELGGEIWRIHRPTENANTHTSELEFNKICCRQLVYNNGTREDLLKTIDRMITLHHTEVL